MLSLLPALGEDKHEAIPSFQSIWVSRAECQLLFLGWKIGDANKSIPGCSDLL